MTTTQVTDEAMMAASMSIFISDQGMLNAGISSVVFSNAVGATEGTLNLINADTVTDEKLRAELKEEEEKNQDAFEAAADMAIAMAEEQLKRLSNPVLYTNGQFTIGGLTVDEEDMDATVDSMVQEFDAVVAKHNLDTEQSAALFALLTAYQNTEDPQVKAQILDQIAEDVSPDVQHDMAKIANDIGNPETKRFMSSLETQDQNVALSNNETERMEARTQIVDNQTTVRKATLAETLGDVGPSLSFEDMMAASDEFNPAASGNVSVVEASNDKIVSPFAAPTAAI